MSAPSQFDELADAYEATFTELPFRREVEAPTVWQAIGELDGRQVLDLGCGPGVYTREAARRGARPVFGIDTSAGMLAYARRREQHQPLGVRYREADITQARRAGDPEIDQHCDIVVAVYVLPYATTAPALTAMCRFARACLRDGGRLVAAVMNPEFRRDPGYYRPYGFDLTTATPDQAPLRDGDEVVLHSEAAGHTFSLTAYYWSRDTHDHALHTAGFGDIAWQSPTCAAGPADQFHTYLAHPHAQVITATAE